MSETTYGFCHSVVVAWKSFRAARRGGQFSLAVLLLVLGVASCSRVRTSPVSGVVLLDGKPLAGASVTFVPDGTGRDATGETDKDGQFTMSTFEPRDGALPGTYKVVISLPAGTADTKTYSTAEDAMSGTSKMAKKAAPSPLPAKYSRADQTPLSQEVPVKGKVVFELTSK